MPYLCPANVSGRQVDNTICEDIVRETPLFLEYQILFLPQQSI